MTWSTERRNAMDARNAAICARRVAGASLREIGNEFKLTGERIRQIVTKAARRAAKEGDAPT